MTFVFIDDRRDIGWASELSLTKRDQRTNVDEDWSSRQGANLRVGTQKAAIDERPRRDGALEPAIHDNERSCPRRNGRQFT
jgi:hypothetical protein